MAPRGRRHAASAADGPAAEIRAVELADSFGATAKLLARVLTDRLGGQGASMPRLRLLAELTEHGPMRLTELAHRLDASQGPTSALVEALTKEGLVERAVDPQDRRATRVAATTTGRRRAQAWSKDYQAAAEELFAALPRSEWPALKRILDTLREGTAYSDIAARDHGSGSRR